MAVVADLIGGMVREVIGTLPKPRDGIDGKDADPAEIFNNLRIELLDAVAAIPAPLNGRDGKDGQSVHADTVFRMVVEQVEKAVAQAPRQLVQDGAPGRDALAIEILPTIDEAKSYPRGTFAEYAGGMIRAIRNTDPIKASLEVAGWIVCMNGIASELEETTDEGRTITRTTIYTNGRRMVREIKTTALLYRGVWREGEYQPGDVTTWSGSGWHCEKTSRDKPGTSDAWKLMVKHGSPGKDGAAGSTASASPSPVRLK